MASELSKLDLDEGKFLSLLEKLIGESQHLQNNPPELVPVEDRWEPAAAEKSSRWVALHAQDTRPCALLVISEQSRDIQGPEAAT